MNGSISTSCWNNLVAVCSYALIKVLGRKVQTPFESKDLVLENCELILKIFRRVQLSEGQPVLLNPTHEQPLVLRACTVALDYHFAVHVDRASGESHLLLSKPYHYKGAAMNFQGVDFDALPSIHAGSLMLLRCCYHASDLLVACPRLERNNTLTATDERLVGMFEQIAILERVFAETRGFLLEYDAGQTVSISNFEEDILRCLGGRSICGDYLESPWPYGSDFISSVAELQDAITRSEAFAF